MIELVLTKADECRPLRAALLRAGQGPQDSAYAGDDDERTLHFAVKDDAQVVGTISLFHEPRGELGSEVWRVRGLAVLPERRGQGLGRMLLLAAQAVVEKRGGGAWARVGLPDEPFYARFGFRRRAEQQPPSDHVVMTWRPKP